MEQQQAMLTSEELAAIHARAEAATPGPWRIEDGIGLYGVMATRRDAPHDDIALAGLFYSPNGGADAAFMAHARADVPRLLAMVAGLTAREMALSDALRSLLGLAYWVQESQPDTAANYYGDVEVDITRAEALLKSAPASAPNQKRGE